MYGIPCNANKVLRISSSGEVTMIGDEALLAGHWKWHGGVLVPLPSPTAAHPTPPFCPESSGSVWPFVGGERQPVRLPVQL